MRIAAIGLFFSGCLAIAAASDTHGASKPSDTPTNKKASWWDTAARPAAAEKRQGRAAAPAKAPRPQASESAIEPIRWPEREARQRKDAPWVIEIEK